MALPTITINVSTGSDTAASGSGGTAVSGTGASVTNGSASVDLSADSPDLSGVATDGSAVVWVNTASGRQFSKISAVDNGTKIVTVQNTVWTTGSGKQWGIGGKRATIGTKLPADVYEGWTVKWDDTTLSISSAISWTPTASASDGPLIICGPSESSRLAITQSANAEVFTLGTASVAYELRHLSFANSNATKTAAFGILSNASNYLRAVNCVFGDSSNKLNAATTRNAGIQAFAFIDCEIKHCTTGSLGALSGTTVMFAGCWIHDCTSHGIALTSGSLTALRTIIEDNGGDGINCASGTTIRVIDHCTIDGNTGDGIDTSAQAAILLHAVVTNNNITANGGYGITAAASSHDQPAMLNYNNFGTSGTANTSGARNNLNAGTGDLAVDPGYVDGANNNFGVGANVQSLAFPLATRNIGANNSATVNYSDIGAAQHQSTGGSGGGRRPVARIMGA